MGHKRKKVVISGYYGFDNCGDEAVLLAIIHCLRALAPDLRLVVLSANPQKTAALYGVEAADRWKPFTVLWRLLGCRLFISGGGSLLQDVTSKRSPRYYFSVIRLGQIFARKTMIYAQGIGPLSVKSNQAQAVKLLEKCDEVVLRDGESAAFLKQLGLTKYVRQCSDPVMALSYEEVKQEEGRALLEAMGMLDSRGRKEKPLLLVSPRCWGDGAHLREIARALDAQAAAGWDVLLVPAHFPGDMEAIDQIGGHMEERFYLLGKTLTAAQYLSLTAMADKVFSMRLHGLISAMAMGVPMVVLSYDLKVSAFMEQAGMSAYCLSLEDFSGEKAAALLEELEYLPLAIRETQETRRKEMQEMAWETARLAVELLG